MNYQVFARKYRPKTFDDVLGQDHVVRTLKNAISQNRLAHAYLFVGPRGTGKTSTSRIFAKALNCPGGPKVDFDPEDDLCIEIAEGRSLDVLEIDGASNNGVEQIRELRDNVHFAPARGQFRIYYIDEVHMLTGAAFNALLKTLEEPPPHVKFIFATTEPHKILPTILSRCQRFDLRRIPTPIIAKHLLYIAEQEGVKLDPLAAHAIAVGADGGMRDAQSMLDQLVAFCGQSVAEQDVLNVFGFTSAETVSRLGAAVLTGETATALNLLYEQSESGKDLSRLLADLIFHFRNILVHKVDPEIARRDLPPEVMGALEEQAGMAGNDKLMRLIDQLAEVEGSMRWAPNKRLYFEIGLIRAGQTLGEVSLSDVVMALRGAMQGAPALPAAAAPARGGEGGGAARPAAALPVSSGGMPGGNAAPGGGSWRDSVKAALEAEAPKPAPAPAPAPVAAAPVAAALPAPEPEAEPPAAAVEPGPDLWMAAQAEFSKSFPLQAGYAKEAQYAGFSGKTLTLAVPGDQRMAAMSLERPTTRAALEEVLSRLAGRKLTLAVEVREDLVSAPSPEWEPEPEPVRASAPAAAAAPAAAPAAGAEPPPTDPATLEAEFRNDPLIREALDLFKARVTGKS